MHLRRVGLINLWCLLWQHRAHVATISNPCHQGSSANNNSLRLAATWSSICNAYGRCRSNSRLKSPQLRVRSRRRWCKPQLRWARARHCHSHTTDFYDDLTLKLKAFFNSGASTKGSSPYYWVRRHLSAVAAGQALINLRVAFLQARDPGSVLAARSTHPVGWCSK